jgi:hypothetical protein
MKMHLDRMVLIGLWLIAALLVFLPSVRKPKNATPAALLLQEFLDEHQLSVADAAQALQIPVRLMRQYLDGSEHVPHSVRLALTEVVQDRLKLKGDDAELSLEDYYRLAL